jgi:hypothetical protein
VSSPLDASLAALAQQRSPFVVRVALPVKRNLCAVVLPQRSNALLGLKSRLASNVNNVNNVRQSK